MLNKEVLPTQQSICNKLDMILSTVRRAAESKNWDRIVVSASNSTVFNQLISNFPVIPDEPPCTIIWLGDAYS